MVVESAYTEQTSTVGGSTQGGTGVVVVVEGGPESCSATIDATTNTSITLALSSSSDANGYYIYRSETPGFDPTPSNRIADVSRSRATQTYDDTGLPEGATYYYEIEAYNNEGVTADTAAATTVLPAADRLRIVDVDGDQADIAWRLQSVDEDGVRVLLSTDDPGEGAQTWTSDSGDLPPGTESYTTANLLDGERYWVTVEVFTSDATTRTDLG